MKSKITLLIFFTAFLCNAQNSPQNLLLHYAFNGNANDSNVNANSGVPFNITYGPDRFGNPNAAAVFNCTTSYVNFPNSAAPKVSLPATFSFWVKYADTNYQTQAVFNSSFENNRATGI